MSTVGNWRGPNIVKDGLVLYLDAGSPNSYINGISDTSWKDISGNANNGTLVNGPTFNSGNGGSIVFDGIDDRVSKVGAVDTGQNFTVNVWIYPTLMNSQKAIIGNGYPYTNRIGWLLATSGGVANTFFLSIGSDNSYRTAAANTLILNTWQYITAVVTNGGGTITLYLNGQTTGTANSSITSGTITYSNTEFNIGIRSLSNPNPYAGRISQTTIYNRALSSTEIQQNFNATRARFGI